LFSSEVKRGAGFSAPRNRGTFFDESLHAFLLIAGGEEQGVGLALQGQGGLQRASMPARITSLICSAASGGIAAMVRAISSAVLITSASGTISLTSPATQASCAVIGRPVSAMRMALALPTARTRRWVPPMPGMMPMRISGWQKRALAGNQDVGQHRQLAAAAIGIAADRRDHRLGAVLDRRPHPLGVALVDLDGADAGHAVNVAPAANTLSPPVSTMQRTEGSAPSSANICDSKACNSRLKALVASGRCRRTTAIPSSGRSSRAGGGVSAALGEGTDMHFPRNGRPEFGQAGMDYSGGAGRAHRPSGRRGQGVCMQTCRLLLSGLLPMSCVPTSAPMEAGALFARARVDFSTYERMTGLIHDGAFDLKAWEVFLQLLQAQLRANYVSMVLLPDLPGRGCPSCLRARPSPTC
jgi:hypothetical protein